MAVINPPENKLAKHTSVQWNGSVWAGKPPQIFTFCRIFTVYNNPDELLNQRRLYQFLFALPTRFCTFFNLFFHQKLC